MHLGQTLGHYRILSKLGEGGMGVVYRARDERLDREVAVKVLPEEVATDPERLARFEREAQAVARLSHPSILDIHDFGSEGGVTFAVIELDSGAVSRVAQMQGRPTILGFSVSPDRQWILYQVDSTKSDIMLLESFR